MMTLFPTIHELEVAIKCMWNADSVEYNQKNYTFNVMHLIAYPVYVGGSIDSVDFEESYIVLSFHQAYKCWKDMIAPPKMETEIVAPPSKVEDDGLPF